MKAYIQKLPAFVDAVRDIREVIITNIVLTGQIPSPTFQEARRVKFMLDRMAEFQADESATDSYGNAVGIIRGTRKDLPPIFVMAHIDTFVDAEHDHYYSVTENAIRGAGASDNSAAAGVLLSLPEIFRRLGISFESDIVLAGTIESLGKGNLRGVRRLMNTWNAPVRAAICLESVELGRLNYFSDSMIRGEILCHIAAENPWEDPIVPNAILVLNETINQILQIRLPQKPRTRIVIGKISGGFNHGKIAYEADIGFEIRSDADEMAREIYAEIRDIVDGVNKEYRVELTLNRISNLNATRLKYNHPLVKAGGDILEALGVAPVSEPTETALPIFLSRNIPAVTLGLTRGDNFHQANACVEIEPLFKGIAQTLGMLMAIDSGVCDEQNMAAKKHLSS